MAPPTFLDCPAEIHIKIASFCPPVAIFNLLCSSKVVYTRCLTELYRDVDVSIHTDARYVKAVEQSHQYPEGWLGQPIYEFLHVLRKKQLGFLETLVEKPELAGKVRSIKWTVLGAQNILEIFEADTYESLELPHGRLWRVLESMTNVKTVDMAQACALDISCRLLDMPNDLRLFPQSTSVTLRGYMNVHLATAILESSDPARLIFLKLDSFRDLDGKFLEKAFLGLLESIPNLDKHALHPILARCKSLERLEIVENGHLWGHTWGLELELYKDLYKLYAELISNAKPTLDVLMFETQPKVEKQWFGNGMPTMYWRFLNDMLVQGPWPVLTVIRIPILYDPPDYRALKTWAMEFMENVGSREEGAYYGPEVYVHREVYGMWRTAIKDEDEDEDW